MTTEQANEIADNCAVDVEVREGYSGRGMYGKEVTGLVVESASDLIAIGYAAAEAAIELSDLPHRTDSMGRSIIVY